MNLTTPLTNEVLQTLKSGDIVSITGKIYTARDAAHKKLVELIEEGKKLPINIKDEIIYYAGPCPAKPGNVIGSAGPTTSGRMDAYAPCLIKLGLSGMVGKGERNASVIEAMKEYGSIYFGAIGGAGALISKKILKAKVVAFEELGTEAIRELWVEDFPCVVIIDSEGNDLYKSERKKYERG